MPGWRSAEPTRPNRDDPATQSRRVASPLQFIDELFLLVRRRSSEAGVQRNDDHVLSLFAHVRNSKARQFQYSLLVDYSALETTLPRCGLRLMALMVSGLGNGVALTWPLRRGQRLRGGRDDLLSGLPAPRADHIEDARFRSGLSGSIDLRHSWVLSLSKGRFVSLDVLGDVLRHRRFGAAKEAMASSMTYAGK